MEKQRFTFLFRILLFAGVYFAAAKFGLSLAGKTAQVSAVWPPTGIALAVLLIFGIRYWPAVAIGAFVANITTSEPVLTALGITFGNTLTGVAGAYCLEHFWKIRSSLDRVKEVFGFIIIAVATPLISASIGTFSLSVSGLLGGSPAVTWLTWWVGDLMGILIATPLLFTWSNREAFAGIRGRLPEVAALVGSTILVSLLIFVRGSEDLLAVSSLRYALFPFMIWAAVRFSQIGVATAAFIASIIAVGGSVFCGLQFAAGASPEQNLILFEAFFFVTIATSMFLAAAVAETREGKQSLVESENRYRQIVELSPDAIFIRVGTRMVFANSSAVTLLGAKDKADLLSRDVLTLIHADDVERVRERTRILTQEFKPVPRTEERLIRLDGRMVEVETVAVPFIYHGQRAAQVVMRDIGERKATEQLKNDFISLVGHQLKTPIAQVKGYISNMLAGLTGPVADKQKDYLEEMLALSDRSYRLVADILNVSRIERGVLVVDCKETPLREIVDGALREYYERAKRRGVELRVGGMEDEVLVLADKAKMVEALKNVVDNAVKFTEHGSVSVALKTRAGYGVVEVTDSGPGIPADKLKEVFTKSLILSGEPKAEGSSGLGLYIAKSFMNLQRGDVSVVSAPGKGSTFTITIPLFRS